MSSGGSSAMVAGATRRPHGELVARMRRAASATPGASYAALTVRMLAVG
jgi:hypothetical protein